MLGFFETSLKQLVAQIVTIPQRKLIPTARVIKKAPMRLSSPLSAKFSNIFLIIRFTPSLSFNLRIQIELQLMRYLIVEYLMQLQSLSLANVEPEKYDVSVLNNVFLTLLDVLSFSLHSVLVSVLHQVLVFHYLGTDEPFLEVSVDHSCSLRGLGVLADSPAPDFVCPGSEEVNQIQRIVARFDNFGQHGSLICTLVLKLSFFMFRTVGDDFSWTVVIDIIFDLFQPFVLLADEVLFAQIDQVDDSLGCDEAMGVENADFIVGPVSVSHPLVLGQKIVNLIQNFLLFSCFFGVGPLDDLVQVFEPVINVLQIFQDQFSVNDFHISDRVN